MYLIYIYMSFAAFPGKDPQVVSILVEESLPGDIDIENISENKLLLLIDYIENNYDQRYNEYIKKNKIQPGGRRKKHKKKTKKRRKIRKRRKRKTIKQIRLNIIKSNKCIKCYESVVKKYKKCLRKCEKRKTRKRKK